MKRKTLLNRTDKDRQKEDVSFQLQEDEQQLAADLLETNRQLRQAKRELVELKSAEKLSPSSVIAKQDEVAGLEAGVKALEELKKELF